MRIAKAVAHGEAPFNYTPITITGVAGINDLPGLIPFPDQNDLATWGNEVMDLTSCGLHSR
jgi:hypothetical protein